jgi:hypothetical protein
LRPEEKKKKKKREKWGRVTNCEEEMRVGNEMGGVRGDVCLWWGRSKKEREGGTWVVGKKIGKKKEKINEEVWYMGGGDKRKEKRNGKGVYCGKKSGGEKKEKKKLKGKKRN